MIELLGLCGFEPNEVKSALPRIEKAFNKVGITAIDIEHGKERLNKYYDIELEGLRKIFKLSMLEMVDMILAREEGKKEVIFGFMAPAFEIIGTVLNSNSNEVLAAHHSSAFHTIMGCVFAKMVPILEAAERKWLKAGKVTHCANTKTILGLIDLDLIPHPDLLITSGFLCETAPKTIEYLREIYSIPSCYIDTCQDRSNVQHQENTKRIIQLAAGSWKKLVGRVQETVGFEITDKMLQESIGARGKLAVAVRRVKDVIENADPLPAKSTIDTQLMGLMSMSMDLDHRFPEAISAMNTLHDELQERVNKGIGVVEKGAPRILGILPGHHTDPRLDYMVNEMGLAMIATDADFGVAYDEPMNDPYSCLSLSLTKSLLLSLPTRVQMIIDLCRKLNIDGILDRYHVGCRTVTGDAMIIAEAAGTELGIPSMLLEWENFDPRAYSHEQFNRRLKVFKTTLSKKAN